MALLFDRIIALDVGPPGALARRVEGLRVDFNVKHSLTSTPNQADIQIFNPGDALIGAIQAPDAVLRLVAGYQSEGSAPGQIFIGSPIRDGITITRTNTERVARIRLQDGQRRFQRAQVNVAYRQSVTFRQVITDLAQQLNLPLDEIQIPDTTFPRGRVLFGKVSDVLDTLALSTDSIWAIQDGALRFFPRSGALAGLAVAISSQTGSLIGSPVTRDQGRIEVTSLLIPAIRPGRRIQLQSDQYTGTFIAEDVSYVGSNYGNPFYTVTVARPA